MRVVLPHHAGDLAGYARAYDTVTRQAGQHEIIPLFQQADGTVRGAPFKAKMGKGMYATINSIFTGCVEWFHARGAGEPFLWMETDCVLTRSTALNEIEAAVREAMQRKPDLIAFGHDKRDQAADLTWLTGSSVYICTDKLLALLPQLRRAGRGFDAELGCTIYQEGDPYIENSPLLRCFYYLHSEWYLRGYEGSWAKVWDRHRDAAFIHGCKTDDLYSLVLRDWR